MSSAKATPTPVLSLTPPDPQSPPPALAHSLPPPCPFPAPTLPLSPPPAPPEPQPEPRSPQGTRPRLASGLPYPPRAGDPFRVAECSSVCPTAHYRGGSTPYVLRSVLSIGWRLSLRSAGRFALGYYSTPRDQRSITFERLGRAVLGSAPVRRPPNRRARVAPRPPLHPPSGRGASALPTRLALGRARKTRIRLRAPERKR